jgi:LPPG:FO 2-phospho-L-lactate transferase
VARVPGTLRRIVKRPVEAVIVCPSNPYISIAPILAVSEISRWLRGRDFPVVAVSPIVGGRAIKGPAAKMMRDLGQEVSPLGVARHYGALVDGWIIDRKDAKLAPAIEREGQRVLVTDTIMSSRAKSVELAERAVAFTRVIARSHATKQSHGAR